MECADIAENLVQILTSAASLQRNTFREPIVWLWIVSSLNLGSNPLTEYNQCNNCAPRSQHQTAHFGEASLNRQPLAAAINGQQGSVAVGRGKRFETVSFQFYTLCSIIFTLLQY